MIPRSHLIRHPLLGCCCIHCKRCDWVHEAGNSIKWRLLQDVSSFSSSALSLQPPTSGVVLPKVRYKVKHILASSTAASLNSFVSPLEETLCGPSGRRDRLLIGHVPRETCYFCDYHHHPIRPSIRPLLLLLCTLN